MIDPTQARVLVVEDNADNLFLVTSLLRREVNVAYVNGRASGKQFFKLVDSMNQVRPDLVLLDIQVPGEDGYAILQKIRNHPTLHSVCVVALTANTGNEYIERAQTAGFNGFIGKPINFHRFPDQIRRILAGESVWEPDL